MINAVNIYVLAFILKVFYGIIITGNNSIESLILSAFSGM